MSEGYIGEIRLVGFNFAPTGWALCNGQLISISQNQALFAIIGTAYGGDGVQTFGLPNFQGRGPVHQGQGPGLSSRVIGEITGNENATVLTSNMPSHTHTLNASTAGGDQASPNAAVSAAIQFPGGAGSCYANSAPNTTMAPTSIGNAGGSIPIEILQPLLCVSFIICLFGVFPSRN